MGVSQLILRLNLLKNSVFFEPDELKIKELLERELIESEVHKEFICGKKKMSIDFLISKSRIPKLALEVTRVSKRRKKDLITKVEVLDHRFRILKLFHPDIMTAMFLQCDKSQVDLLRRIVEREVIDTDFVIIRSLEELLVKIKESI